MAKQVDVIIVGAGFAGLYALHRIRQLGMMSLVLEAGDDIGGTWQWNAYPGARCDVESFQYSYSFDDDLQQEWDWHERYASQPEILAYLRHVVARYKLDRDIRFNSRVESAVFDEPSSLWTVKTADNTYHARYLVLAVGCLSKPNLPAIAGLDDFRGKWTHTGLWPREGLDLAGKRVGIIGTGSSGVQLTAEIADTVKSLHVFQRTPHWVAMAGNHALTDDNKRAVKARYGDMRAFLRRSLLGMNVAPGDKSALDVDARERRQTYEQAWETGGPALLMAYNDLLVNPAANRTAADFVAAKIREIVRDPATAEALIPDADTYPVGGRRMVQDDRYYATFNRDNVTLVDTRQDPIERITSRTIQMASGNKIGLDVIVFATGFDAVTGTVMAIDIRGKNGQSLNDKWREGPHSYLGLAVAGFPNCFIVTGPGSPSVLSNMVLSIEQHVDWIADAIGWMVKHGHRRMEASREAETDWAQRVIEAARPTVLYNTKSWYFGENVPGKPRVFMAYLGGVGPYRDECDAIAAAGYPGFEVA